MKYWLVLAAKLAAGAALLWAGWLGVRALLPRPKPFLYEDLPPMGHDLWHTLAAFLYWLVAVGALFLLVHDHRYRCRACLRRLRMPVERGSWDGVLLAGPPRTEYICPYGHGTLQVPEVQITGLAIGRWKAHRDIWTELSGLEETKR